MPVSKKNAQSTHNLYDKLARKIELVNIGELNPYENNSRTHSQAQIEQIARSIEHFGFTNPILIDADKIIIAGHGRLEAAKLAGLEQVPAITIEHLTKEQKRAYVIADNKLALNAGWDNRLLAMELKELQLDDFDIDLLGFSEDELEDLFLEDDEEEDVVEGNGDSVGEPPEDPVTKLGDVWVLGKHRLLCGDSTVMDNYRILLEDQKAHLVVTDPPYNVSYEGKTKEALTIENGSMTPEEFKEFLSEFYVNCIAFMRDGASIYVFHADMESVNFRTAFTEAGFKLAQNCIWAKQHFTFGRFDYHYKHEPVLYGWKPGAAHNWYGDRPQTSVWEFDRPTKNDVHPTMKPIDLIEYPIANSSKKGQLVLDPFGGSGSTLIACNNLGRQARLIELDPRYCDVIVNRWQDMTGKSAVLESSGQKFNDIR